VAVYLFLASNLALQLLQQKATVLPSLPLLVMLESAGLPLMGHLSEGNDGEQSFHRLSMFGMFEARRDCRAVGKTYETPRLLSILIFSLPFRPPTP
jgi:hypothetical protein